MVMNAFLDVVRAIPGVELDNKSAVLMCNVGGMPVMFTDAGVRIHTKYRHIYVKYEVERLAVFTGIINALHNIHKYLSDYAKSHSDDRYEINNIYISLFEAVIVDNNTFGLTYSINLRDPEASRGYSVNVLSNYPNFSFIPTKSELGAVETVRLNFHDGYVHSRKCPDGEYVKFPIGDKCALFIQMSSLEWWIGAGTHVPKMPAIYRQPVQMIYKYRLFDVIPGPGDKERLDSIINLMVGDL